MSRMILVPIDISDKEFTERIISHVESEARIDDAEVHFLSVIPSLPYYASLGMAYTAELPGMDELREGTETQLKEIATGGPLTPQPAARRAFYFRLHRLRLPARSGKCRKDADILPLNPYHTRHGCLSDLINCYAPAPRCPGWQNACSSDATL